MFSETSCSVLFSCEMRMFVTRQPCWDQLRKYQAPSTSRNTANRNALSLSEMTCDWPKSPSRAFLKPENRAMRRSRSQIFSQNTWITICLKGYYGNFAQWCQNNSAFYYLKFIIKIVTDWFPVGLSTTQLFGLIVVSYLVCIIISK